MSHAILLLLRPSAVDENDLIGLAKGVGPDLLKVAPAALSAAPAALPLLAGALGVPGESLYLAGLASFAAGKSTGDLLSSMAHGESLSLSLVVSLFLSICPQLSLPSSSVFSVAFWLEQLEFFSFF